MSVFPRPGRRLGIGLVASVLALSAVAVSANATVRPGTPAKDVTVGADNDNANNTFIQPPGVAAKQHMENTDLLFGRDNDDLLIGKLGSDTLLGGAGSDITVGGPEAFATPNSDVMDGEDGADINIWAPGDGSELYVGERGYDVQVFAPFVLRPNNELKLVWANGRKVPRVDIGGQPALSCRDRPGPGQPGPRRAVPRPVPGQRQPHGDRAAQGRRGGAVPEPVERQGQDRRPVRRQPDVPAGSGSTASVACSAPSSLPEVTSCRRTGATSADRSSRRS